MVVILENPETRSWREFYRDMMIKIPIKIKTPLTGAGHTLQRLTQPLSTQKEGLMKNSISLDYSEKGGDGCKKLSGCVDLLEGIGESVSYYPSLNHITGDINASILLEELIKQCGLDDETCLTDDRLKTVLGFSRNELGTARQRLIKARFISVKAKGLPRKNYYSINREAVCGAWKEYLLNLESALEKKRKSKNSTKEPGFVYVIHAIGTERYKVGLSKDYPSRAQTLSRQCPYPLEIVAVIYSEDMDGTEYELHDKFDSRRVHGEWFELTDTQIEELKAIAIGEGKNR